MTTAKLAVEMFKIHSGARREIAKAAEGNPEREKALLEGFVEALDGNGSRCGTEIENVYWDVKEKLENLASETDYFTAENLTSEMTDVMKTQDLKDFKPEIEEFPDELLDRIAKEWEEEDECEAN